MVARAAAQTTLLQDYYSCGFGGAIISALPPSAASLLPHAAGETGGPLFAGSLLHRFHGGQRQPAGCHCAKRRAPSHVLEQGAPGNQHQRQLAATERAARRLNSGGLPRHQAVQCREHRAYIDGFGARPYATVLWLRARASRLWPGLTKYCMTLLRPQTISAGRRLCGRAVARAPSALGSRWRRRDDDAYTAPWHLRHWAVS